MDRQVESKKKGKQWLDKKVRKQNCKISAVSGYK